MIKKNLIKIACTMISASLIMIIIILHALASINLKNGFNRKFVNSRLEKYQTFSLSNKSSVFCGIGKENIYLGGGISNNICQMNLSTGNIKWIDINIPEFIQNRRSCSFKIDSPNILIFNANNGAFYKTFFGSTNYQEIKTIYPIYTRSVVVNQNTAILRAFNETRKCQKFEKVSLNSGKTLATGNILSDSNSTFGFSTDGLLKSSKKNNKIFYLQSYQNIFYCFDTNLNINYIAKTIDTNNVNKMHTGIFESNGTNKMESSTPVHSLYKSLTVFDNNLYIISSLKSDNEKLDEFNKNSVVDIYNQGDGKYIKSIYIPDFSDTKAIDFQFISNSLAVAIYPNELIIYKIPREIIF